MTRHLRDMLKNGQVMIATFDEFLACVFSDELAYLGPEKLEYIALRENSSMDVADPFARRIQICASLVNMIGMTAPFLGQFTADEHKQRMDGL